MQFYTYERVNKKEVFQGYTKLEKKGINCQLDYTILLKKFMARTTQPDI